MANYPGFFHLSDSSATAQSGVEPARASNGKLRMRRLWPDDKHSFELGHALTLAQRDSYQAFYAANKNLDVAYTWPGDRVVRTVRFAAPPQYRVFTRHVEARVRLEEV